MRRHARLTVTLLGCVMAWSGVAFAQGGQRMTDKEVKALLESVDNARDRFEDQLDGKLKNQIVRGANGEVDVARFLDDLQENTGRLKERFTPEYAASSEVAAVLRQGGVIAAFMKEHPGIKGSSEWDRMAGELGKVAAAYGTTFPLEGDAPVRRINDREAANAASTIAEQADKLKNAVNREQTLAKPAKDALKGQVDAVKNAANALKSRLKDSKPSTSEARQLVDAVRALREAAKGVSPASLSVLGQMQAPLSTLSQAFAIPLTSPGT